MKILLLADSNSSHTEKWALGLANSGLKIGLFSFNKSNHVWYNHANIKLLHQPQTPSNANNLFTKIAYIKHLFLLKRAVKQFNPDILHAHYASSYGLLGALSRFKPFIISVWGSDVYNFPKKSFLHEKIFRYNLKNATAICSTSITMRNEILQYTSKKVAVIPFGIDPSIFKPNDNSKKQNNIINIGTIKSIEEKYGIKYIINAAEKIMNKYHDKSFMFFLIGRGNRLEYYKKYIRQKKLTQYFTLTDKIAFSEIQNYHNMLDIFLNVSIDDSESFGVAVIEAMACEKPIIVSNTKGLMEVVDNGKYAKVIPKKDENALTEAIDELLTNDEYMNKNKLARQHVIKNYNWNENLQKMILEYENALQNSQHQNSAYYYTDHKLSNPKYPQPI